MVCFHTGTPSSAPTIGGANEGSGNFFLSWPLEVKIGSVAGVAIAVFIVCLVCLVVLGLVLYHSKKRRKEFETGKNVPITIY